MIIKLLSNTNTGTGTPDWYEHRFKQFKLPLKIMVRLADEECNKHLIHQTILTEIEWE